MALVDCRECGRSVSDAAASCPHCGVANPCGEKNAEMAISRMANEIADKMVAEDQERWEIRRGLIVWVVIILLGIAFFMGLLDPLLRYVLT